MGDLTSAALACGVALLYLGPAWLVWRTYRLVQAIETHQARTLTGDGRQLLRTRLAERMKTGA